MSSADEQAPPSVLSVDDLHVQFPIPRGFLRRPGSFTAVDGISLALQPGEVLGLVGESGCGKSTTARAIVQLIRPQRGSVCFDGRELCALHGAELRRHRRGMQMIFQDPFSSLDPRWSCAQIIAEPLRNFGLCSGTAARKRVRELMHAVGLDPALAQRYPHEFSGGQRQRIGIARALAAEPRVLLCDEPVSALDVSVQAQIINLLARLRRELGLAMLFIAHDLAVVRHIADRVAVMHEGRIVEHNRTDALFAEPQHDYTRKLLGAVPIPDPSIERARLDAMS